MPARHAAFQEDTWELAEFQDLTPCSMVSTPEP
jgi:hypothetical protein